jgi:hypothetical protein
MNRPACCFLALLCASCSSPGSTLSADRDAKPFALEVEGGPLWQSSNDVAIPGDTGTRFSMKDLIGDGPFPVGRVTADWDINDRHALRAVIAPLEIDGTGTLDQTTSFAGQTFAAGTPTEGKYEFSSYRLGYRYTFLHDEHWRLRVGGTLFVRDAEIELEQAGVAASDSNVGLVPLLNFSAEYFPAKRWRIVGELDGLAAPQGRAFDVAIKGYYDLSDWSSIGLGYRMIEGGVDNDDVYNFAWLHSAVVALSFRF